jgi:uroporphyrinogen decarboxylase
MDPIYEDVISLGVDALSIDAPSSLEKLFEVGRGKTVILGNVDPILFIEGTPDQLREEAKKCFDVSAGEAKYVIGPGCAIPLQAKLENIKAFTQACHEYGTF